jgi:hypothetical protein
MFYTPLAGAVAAVAYLNNNPATDFGAPGGLNNNRFPVGSSVSFPTGRKPYSCASVRTSS